MTKNKSKKWYAIKEGNGVKNKIFTSWGGCEKLVKAYPVVYKGFKTEEETKEYLSNIKDNQVEKVKEKNRGAREFNN